jgi:hypothetical protein
MHAEPPLFHRDIRWPNVIRDAHNPEKWFLIDWDDAAAAPTRGVTHLRPDTHSPRVFLDHHGAEVDLWGVGKLIVEAGRFVPGISADDILFGGSLMSDDDMTAEKALHILNNADMFSFCQ